MAPIDDAQVWTLLGQLWSTAHWVRRGTERHPRDPTRIRLLGMATEGEGFRPADAAAELAVAHPSVSRHVRALEDDGFVELVPMATDGRSYRVRATGTGREEFAAFCADLVETFRPALGGFDADELAALTGHLAALNAAMAALGARREKDTVTRNRWRSVG